jgi:hypothetical protein
MNMLPLNLSSRYRNREYVASLSESKSVKHSAPVRYSSKNPSGKTLLLFASVLSSRYLMNIDLLRRL